MAVLGFALDVLGFALGRVTLELAAGSSGEVVDGHGESIAGWGWLRMRGEARGGGVEQTSFGKLEY